MNKVIVIAGPTASGKTALAIELAQRLNGEIVSADSMQVYRGMDIGTAKATAEEQAAAVHRMLDVADPHANYSAAQYIEDAARCCDDIISRGKMPIIAGGTGLYIDSLISGRDFAAVEEDAKLRDWLGKEYDEVGGEAMLNQLRVFDPERAEKLAANDKRRIIRATEIYMLTGITATEHDRRTREIPPRYDAKRIILGYKDREKLYARIDSRVDAMVAAGLFDEVAGLLADGVSTESTAMQAIGYKEAVLAIRGEIEKNTAVQQIKQNSRRYAKRQLTWFRRWEDALRIDWDDTPDISRAADLAEAWLGDNL